MISGNKCEFGNGRNAGSYNQKKSLPFIILQEKVHTGLSLLKEREVLRMVIYISKSTIVSSEFLRTLDSLGWHRCQCNPTSSGSR